jgi:hypothetical protein
VLLKHTGTYVFDYAAQDQLYKDLHALAISNQQPAQTIAQTTAGPVAEPQAPKATVVASSKGKKKK